MKYLKTETVKNCKKPEKLGPKDWDWKVAIEDFKLKASNWSQKVAIEGLQLKSWDLSVRNEWLQLKGCD